MSKPATRRAGETPSCHSPKPATVYEPTGITIWYPRPLNGVGPALGDPVVLSGRGVPDGCGVVHAAAETTAATTSSSRRRLGRFRATLVPIGTDVMAQVCQHRGGQEWGSVVVDRVGMDVASLACQSSPSTCAPRATESRAVGDGGTAHTVTPRPRPRARDDRVDQPKQSTNPAGLNCNSTPGSRFQRCDIARRPLGTLPRASRGDRTHVPSR